jgi:4-amino-4-deoxy-L-arabinose transferase-like glycosyltransferase
MMRSIAAGAAGSVASAGSITPEQEVEPSSTRPEARRGLEWAGLGALVIVAMAVRWWHLWDIPSPTDELLGVGRGLMVARGQILPLTDWEPYIGSFWNYVLALGFLIAGPSEYVGRAIPFVVGVLTVGATYLLAREMGGKVAGWVAAALIATSSAHTLATSHPGWSHCFSPLFATLGLWQLQRCIRRGNANGLVASAIWLGLALQTHPTMVALLPGAGLFLLLKRRAWLLTRWPILGGLVGLLMVSNIVAFNAITDLGSLRRAEAVQTAYARGRGTGLELYQGNVQRMGLLSAQVISGAIDIREQPLDYLDDPLVVLPCVLALVGAGLLARRGNPIIFLVLVPFGAILALFNAKFEVIPNGRFLTPLLPLVLAGSGAALAMAWRRIAAQSSVGPVRASIGLAIVVAGLSAISLFGLARRYDQMASSAQMSAALTAAVDSLEAARPADEPVLLDRNLDRLWLDGGGDVWMALNFELTRRGTPVSDLPGRVTPPTGETDPCALQRVIVARVDRTNGTPGWLATGVRPNSDQVPLRFWTFRIIPTNVPLPRLRPDEWVVLDYTPAISGSSRTVNRCTPGRLI